MGKAPFRYALREYDYREMVSEGLPCSYLRSKRRASGASIKTGSGDPGPDPGAVWILFCLENMSARGFKVVTQRIADGF